MLITVSDVAVGLLMDALTDMIRGVPTNIDVGVLMGVNLNLFAVVIAVFKVVISDLPIRGVSLLIRV